MLKSWSFIYNWPVPWALSFDSPWWRPSSACQLCAPRPGWRPRSPSLAAQCWWGPGCWQGRIPLYRTSLLFTVHTQSTWVHLYTELVYFTQVHLYTPAALGGDREGPCWPQPAPGSPSASPAWTSARTRQSDHSCKKISLKESFNLTVSFFRWLFWAWRWRKTNVWQTERQTGRDCDSLSSWQSQ